MLIKFNNFLVTYEKQDNWVFFAICQKEAFCCQYDRENLGVLNIFIDFLYIPPKPFKYNLFKYNGYKRSSQIPHGLKSSGLL